MMPALDSFLARARPSRLTHGLRFALRYGLFASVSFGLYTFPYAEKSAAASFLEGYLRAYASVVGFLLSPFEQDLVLRGTTLTGRFSIEIAKNCDAVEVLVLFVCAVLAFAGPWKTRARFALTGALILSLVNVSRIISLYYVGAYSPEAFEILHLEVWPLVLVVVASLLFLVFTARMRRDEGRSVSAGP